MNSGTSRLPLIRPVDWVVIAYLAIEAGLVLMGSGREPRWPWFLAAHAVLIAGIIGLARTAAASSSRFLLFLRDWYPALCIVIVFSMLGALVPAAHPRTYDDMLLQWDRTIFGGHPGAWFDGLASPLTTEILRACWLSYFAMPFLLGASLYLRPNRSAFHEMVLALILGWLLSFLGYYAVPALGPGYFPESVPAPESVGASGVTQSVVQVLFTLEGRKHDIFPSGHTIIALLALWQARRHGLKWWPALAPVVAGLIVGTVFLRYHYGVDVVAGAIIAAAVALVAPRWHARGFTSRAGP